VTLAGSIALDRTTATGVIDRLERKNLVTRQVSSLDRRARLLEITDAGRKMLDAIGPAVESTQTALVSGLTPTEARQLITLLTKAVKALNERSRAPFRSAAIAVA
jgi:DNA-binding MarR family transcriptional regulator